MTERYQAIYQQRLAKLQRLRDRGIDPYPPRYNRSHSTAEALDAFQAWESRGSAGEAPRVSVAGRITATRDMGRATFIDLRDGSGRIQTHFRQNTLGDEAYAGLRDLDLGDFLGVSGPLFRTRSGEVTVQAVDYTVLAKALLPPPEKWHGLQDVETRYRQRYLDLMASQEVRDLFALRSRVISAIRRFMDARGFLEVQTPVLQPEAGGAAATPFVTHHKALDRALYLRIATELHLKRLIIGGFDRVYEIGPVFRNEGISTRHNPEFTMMESYEAYADYHDVARMVEDLVSGVARELLGTTSIVHGDAVIDLEPPWRRLTMREALIEHAGLDFADYRDDPERLRARLQEIGVHVELGWSWGKLIDEAVSTCVEPRLIQPTFLTDYPWELSPLAKRKPEDPELVERFEPFCAGMEFGNAYTELNDPVEQRERFKMQARLRDAGLEDVETMDEDFLLALEHGMPPTGGLGLGIDRLIMILTGQTSIREVILFPQLRSKE
ncbi:MAG: lysine--tRNA ligase [Dehalococcoidia bacterium]